MLDRLFFFEMVLFSYLTGNNDMHLKNFPMIQAESGWILAPAYDLLYVAILLPEDDEELALTLTRKKKKLKRSYFEVFGEGMGLSERQIAGVLKRFLDKRNEAFMLLDSSFLSNDMKLAYKDIIEARYLLLQE